jgi:uncharacterized protein YegP (UPF0339 family)
MAAKFDLKKSSSGKHMFNLKAGNGQIILTSELYDSKQAAQNGIASVKSNAATDAHCERNLSKTNQPYFVLKATNGQVIGQSEMYSDSSGMENGIASVKDNAPDAPIDDQT